jgi:hypothetical protein
MQVVSSISVKPILSNLDYFFLRATRSKFLRFGTYIAEISYERTCGARGSVVVKTLCYKPEGCGFDT